MEMDFEKSMDRASPKKEGQKARSKTSLRMRYEVQSENIVKEIGDLEVIRHRLGLSKRKICQLLFIDPSTWTRWTNFSGKKAPPHIYRMLQWYLLLEEKHPQMHSDYWLRSYTNQTANLELLQSQKDIEQLKVKLRLLERKNRWVLGAFFAFICIVSVLSFTILS